MVHNINAENQMLGRLATKIAVILRGKDNPSFKPEERPNEKIVISNIEKIKFSGKKLDGKVYHHYSGYPGGLKSRVLRTVFEKNPAWVLRHAVYGMLAKNKLRDKIIKNLIFK